MVDPIPEKCDEKGCRTKWLTYAEPTGAPTPIWNGIKMTQKGKGFFLMSGPANEFDSLSMVPAVPEDITSPKLAKLVARGKAREVEWWQRRLSKGRLDEIGRFFKGNKNLFVNPIILGIRRPDVVESKSLGSKHGLTEITMRSWLRSTCPECKTSYRAENGNEIWKEMCSEHSCHTSFRPFLIIDGQHRTRGTQNKNNKERYRKEYIPAVILPKEFSLSDQAKIYAEISVTAEPLDKFHQLWLKYSFGLGDMNPWRKANRLAYETASWLCSYLLGDTRTENPMLGRIQMWKAKKGYIGADMFVKEVKSFFQPDGCLWDQESNSPKGPDIAADEIRNYVKAIKRTWPDAWHEGRDFGYLNSKGIFRRLLRLFPVICERVEIYQEDLRDEGSFHRELRHLKGLSWGRSEDWNRFITPEWKTDILYRILEWKYDPSEESPSLASPHNGVNINSWIKRQPDSFEIVTPVEGSTLNAGDEIRWNEPKNAARRYDVRIAHNSSGTAPMQHRVQKNHYTLQKSDLSAGPVKIEVAVQNHTDKIRISSVSAHIGNA